MLYQYVIDYLIRATSTSKANEKAPNQIVQGTTTDRNLSKSFWEKAGKKINKFSNIMSTSTALDIP
jgi:hypothetical protein